MYLILTLFILLSCINEEPHQTHNQSDISKGLVAYWSFNDDSNEIIKDGSGNNNSGKGISIAFKDGIKGKAAIFNGDDSKILFSTSDIPPPSVISNLQEGSISLWFKYQDKGSQILPIFYFGESQTKTPHNSLIIEIGHGGGTNSSNKRLYFTIVNQRFCYDSGINLLENAWYHFVAVVEKNGNTGYLNGVEMTKRNYNLGSNSSSNSFFNDVPVKNLMSLGYGRYGQEDPFFAYKGAIDEVRIYDRPLNAIDIEELYKQGD